MRPAPPIRWLATTALLLLVPACRSDSADCARCRTLVIAATGEPTNLLPPLAIESVARDIGDQIYERLADLAPGAKSARRS